MKPVSMSIRLSIHVQKVRLIQIKFSIQVHECYMRVCHMTSSKVRVKVMRSLCPVFESRGNSRVS